jgi:4'-phosphopantetheinyl transferase
MARPDTVPPQDPAKVPAGARLQENRAVDVWWLDVDGVEPDLWSLASVLSPRERARAARAGSDAVRRRYTGSHIFLRQVLAAYAGCEAASIVFDYGQLGKPTLSGPNDQLQFSLAHGGGLAAVAVARQSRVGVDIERVDRDYPWDEVSSRVITPEEEHELAGLGEGVRSEAMFRLWTRKEAVAKATGQGLALGLRDLRVGAGGQELAAEMATVVQAAGSAWWLLDLPLGDMWAAALAVEAAGGVVTPPVIRCQRVDDWFDR